MTISKGLGIVVLIYITGLILQEIGSVVDHKGLRIYKGMSRAIIKSSFAPDGQEVLSNEILDNSLLLMHYRLYADSLLGVSNDIKDSNRYNEDDINGYLFSVCQYHVQTHGKSNKIEKLRALFDMSRSLMICFGLLSVASILMLDPDSILYGLLYSTLYTTKIIAFIAFAVLTVLFYYRSRRTMRSFLLVLLGTYDSLRRFEKESSNHA